MVRGFSSPSRTDVAQVRSIVRQLQILSIQVQYTGSTYLFSTQKPLKVLNLAVEQLEAKYFGLFF
jgi:hypothetical protein